MNVRVPLLSLACLFIAVTNARPYSLLGYSWTRNRTVRIQSTLPTDRTLSDGFNFQTSAQDAFDTWNQYLVHLKFAFHPNSPVVASSSDAENSVLFSDTIFGDAFGNGTLAVTLQSFRGPTSGSRVTEEADTVFNSNRQWDSYRGPLRGSVYDFHRVALHEFGHIIGLDHPDEHGQTVAAIMNAYISNIDALTSDDITGAQSLYTAGPPYQNSVPTSALLNLSTRAFVATGEAQMIGGFIVQGSQPATLVLRGLGASLAEQGIATALQDPVIELRNSAQQLVATSDDWISSSDNVDQANPDATTIASYHLDPSNSHESAVIVTLPPGSYTVSERSYDNGDGKLTGTGLVELYDLHTTGGRLGNISTRSQVLGGDNLLIGGFIIGGSTAKAVVARALGPSLAAAGVTNVLSDPAIELRDASGNVVAQNDSWRSDPNATLIQSEGFAPSNDNEAATQTTLGPGSYTAIVRGVNGATGIGLVELYDLSSVQ